jgi:D-glycero-alpha-D-manno-heptose-7-phosphate kinase
VRTTSSTIAVRAPARIDFGGGWTDVPPYPERDGGYVCNVAITRYAHVEVVRYDGAHRAPAAGDALAAAALREAGVRADVSITNDFPVGSGLGGSSAAGVALQAALCRMRGEPWDPEVLAARSRAVEVGALGIAGGWQDHYAAAFGGALGIDFGSTISVERVPLADATRIALPTRCLLVYTGETRISSANITAVLEAYARRDATVISALARMAELARAMADALRAGDIDGLGPLVGEHWAHQRALHPAITTERIEAIVRRATAAGAAGVKALGASGGGCVLVVTGADPAPVQAAIQDLGTLLPWDVDVTGITDDTMSDTHIP